MPSIVDSSALFSLIVGTDKNHGVALKAAKKLLEEKEPFIIPSDVFSETVNALGKKLNHKVAFGAGEDILASNAFSITDTSERLRINALDKFKNQPESVSFTDCLVMAFADEFETKEIFGFDECFKKNGYTRIGID